MLLFGLIGQFVMMIALTIGVTLLALPDFAISRITIRYYFQLMPL
jgi:hypothetical protein